MAVTARAQTISSFWTRDQIISALETAFSNAGLHGAGLSGLVKGYFDSGTSTQYTHYGPGRGASGGGTHGSLTNDSSGFGSQTDYGNFEFRNIPASGGTGSGATFDVSYTNGTLEFCHVNNPGSGYTNGDTLTISASNLLGTSNGSANITITANVDSTTYGSSSTFFQKQGTSSDLYPWAVLKLDKDTSKKYGSTYFFIQVVDDTKIAISPFLFWNPTVKNECGGQGLELMGNAHRGDSSGVVDPLAVTGNVSALISHLRRTDITYAIDTSYDIKLRSFQAQAPQDTGFSMFAFSQPDITATDEIQDLVKAAFAFPHWTTSVYDLDYVGDLHFVTFNNTLTGISAEISQEVNTQGEHNSGNGHYIIANSLNGWSNAVATLGESETELGFSGNPAVRWISAKSGTFAPGGGDQALYKRDASREQSDYGDANSAGFGRGYSGGFGYQTAGGYGNVTARTKHTIIRGIPYLPQLHPSVYTLPDDFVIIEFEYSTPLQQFLPNDTLTVSGSEVYTIIVGGQDLTDNNETRALFLCARTT